MKASEVLRLLKITRSGLTRKIQQGHIKAVRKFNGRYEYDDESVYAYIGKEYPPKTAIYARVPSEKDAEKLNAQINACRDYCDRMGFEVKGVYSDTGDSIAGMRCPQFLEALTSVMKGEAERLVVQNRDTLTPELCDFLAWLASKFDCTVCQAEPGEDEPGDSDPEGAE